MKSLLSAFAIILFCSLCSAQQTVTSGSLTGRVIDPSGSVVTRAHIVALSLATNQSFSTETDEQGRFRLPYLPAGGYRISATAGGFAEAVSNAQLTVGSAFDVTMRLSLAATSQSIKVTDQTPAVETNRSQVSETVSQTEVAGLPYQGRNYLDAALLLPGVSPTNTASTQTLAETSEVVGQGYSVNSQRNFSNSFIVDGLSNNDDAAGVAGNAYSMDVVQEFQVVTSGGQAEFGRALGGYFNIITKSGGNDYHGNVYGFLRNQRLNATNALSGTKLPLTQGQYGGSLSGPLRKDRTFFFANFEEGRLNTAGVNTVTPANAAAINARLTAVGYQSPLLPVGALATTQFPTTLHTDTAFFKVDHRFSDKDQFNFHYNFYKLSSANARGVGGLNEPSNGTSVYDTNNTISASNVAALSAHVFNETRFQYSHDDLDAPPNDQAGPAVTISGVAIFGRSTSSPTARYNQLTEGVDNIVIERGSHTFKTGVDFLYNKDAITYPQSLRGAYSFSSLANFLAGVYNAQGYTQNFGAPNVQQSNPNLGLYFQDEWKLTHALTLNAGLRYDLEWLDTINTDANNISPRLGLAWTPFADRKTVVRASYGLFYDRVPLRPLANALLSANNTIDPAQARFFSYSFSPADPGAPVFPGVATAPPAGAKPNYATMDPNIENPYSQQASLEIEQQLTKSATLDLSYQHVRGEHLISSINTNINIDGTRPDPTRGNIKPYSSAFDSYYDGLAVSFLQRPSKWASFRASYTWSKAIDNVGEFFFSSPMNNFNLALDRSRSDDDQRHRLVFDAMLNSPASAAHDLAGHLWHGWALSGILQYYSALPFNITTGANTKQATGQRPCAPGFTLSANGGFNPCTEAQPGAVIGRNAGTGFDFFGLNVRLSRTVAISEKVKLQGIAEAFNALNHRNDMIPNTTFGTGTFPTTPNATFGQPTAVGDPRNVQLALRVSF